MAEKEKENWGNKALEIISQTAFVEQKKARRWGIFFKLATLIYLSGYKCCKTP